MVVTASSARIVPKQEQSSDAVPLLLSAGTDVSPASGDGPRRSQLEPGGVQTILLGGVVSAAIHAIGFRGGLIPTVVNFRPEPLRPFLRACR
jgi:hypothetical protein